MYLDMMDLASYLHVFGYDGFGELAACIWMLWIW